MTIEEHPPTPRMTLHARERCAEMGIPTRVAKRIVQHPDITRPGNPDGRHNLVSVSDAYPDYLVVHTDPADGPVLIVSVQFRPPVRYIRNGTTFIPVED